MTRKIGDPNPGRPEGTRVIALSLEAEAYALLPMLAPSRKAYGQYLSRLIHQDHARREERQRIATELLQQGGRV